MAPGRQAAKEETRPYHVLAAENARLRERLKQLRSQADEGGDVAARFTHLVRKKDRAIDEYTRELEEKTRRLRDTVKELTDQNAALENGMAILQLYETIFASDPAALVGIDTEETIVQFNTSAEKFFGPALHRLRLRPVSELDLPGMLSGLPAMIRASLAGSATRTEMGVPPNGLVVSTYPLTDAGAHEQRGAIIRIARFDGTPTGPADR